MAVPANGSTVRTGHGGKVVAGDYDGTLYLIARVTTWSVNTATTEAAWADSDSAGYTNRVAGRRDATGTIGGNIDKSHPAYQNLMFNIDTDDPNDNDVVSLILWEDGNITTPEVYWLFPRALVSGFSLTFDIDNRGPVGWTANFGADGKFYWPGTDHSLTDVSALNSVLTLSDYELKTLVDNQTH